MSFSPAPGVPQNYTFSPLTKDEMYTHPCFMAIENRICDCPECEKPFQNFAKLYVHRFIHKLEGKSSWNQTRMSISNLDYMKPNMY